ncbi:MAG: hypothetical protein KDB14_04855, partial [Planctomycetales bacterium]|nr:hypothetical protein [Planctomycetales bacterium]
FRAMRKLAATDERIAARLELFQHGVTEEFYDYERDPDALHNLINDPEYQDEIERHRALMRKVMEESHDPVLEPFLRRDEPAVVSAYVDRVQAEADARGGQRAKGKQGPKKKQNAKKRNAKKQGEQARS